MWQFHNQECFTMLLLCCCSCCHVFLCFRCFYLFVLFCLVSLYVNVRAETGMWLEYFWSHWYHFEWRWKRYEFALSRVVNHFRFVFVCVTFYFGAVISTSTDAKKRATMYTYRLLFLFNFTHLFILFCLPPWENMSLKQY